MCLAIPAQIETMNEHDRATVVLDGSRTNVVLTLVPEAKIGDWVLVHAGYAITVLDEADALATYDLLRQMDAAATSEAG
ncbi:MAG: Hydrogenase isoenzymes formation protein HypC [Planctomycetes bacterium ADurb.Bin126]|nr:MAG: Hydrogenase isoenzymes formation protein HypC [Planctomycetes bacterium ADurb.Bin126]HOD82923.1 HypC/HybG/HupF family hydrogenase formation chaperone [Phycisphaerae bacterium]HQL74355.1 HypC/HybG/HupF family hydrogenase formation chaperone [Phycisphaerae bacterium]